MFIIISTPGKKPNFLRLKYTFRRNAFMALFVSCILTMHMMLYFFHHFELPFVLNTFQIRNQTIANFNNDPNATRTTTEEPPRDGNLNDSEVTPPDNIVLESNLGIYYFL